MAVNRRRVRQLAVAAALALALWIVAAPLFSPANIGIDFAAHTTKTPDATPSVTPAPTLTPVKSPMPAAASPTPPAPSPTPSPSLVPPTSPPARLVIAAAGIDAQVRAVGTDEQGRMAVLRSGAQVAWYQGGAVPGAPGNALFAAHNRWSRKDAVFARLGNLKPGDTATITDEDGETRAFVVASVSRYPYTAVPDEVMSLSGETRVTLITCAGSFSSRLGTSQERYVAILTPAAQTP